MARTVKAEVSEDRAAQSARLVTSPEDRAKALKWFERGRELGDKRQFDYAVEYYVNGLEFWPDAVEEACKPLHGCAVARKQMGGKKPGLKDTMKRSLSDKDPRRAFLNAMWLFGHDPDNLGYMEAIVRNAGRLRAENAAFWAAGVYLRALDANPKSGAKQYIQFVQQIDELGDRAAARGESAFGLSVYQIGVDALNSSRRRFPADRAVEEALRDLSTKLTILKGKYKDGDSYQGSVVDAEAQRALHDQQRSFQVDERLDELIAKAQQEYEQNPDEAARVRNLVDLLCRREREEDELRAIRILVNEYKRTDNYRWKHLADDIRMKQLGRKARELTQQADENALKEHQITQLRFELSVYKERAERYPTDNRIKFELGTRYFRAGKFDEAIPIFQSARTDPKNRAACGLYLGRCFFRKGYQVEAISTLEEAVSQYEIPDDDLMKTMLYWLGRAQAAAGRIADARTTFGRLLQLEYNYKDVRARLDELPAVSK
jgi:tetratricopeptide (TPR) repeat protein